MRLDGKAARLYGEICELLRPPPAVELAEWANRHRTLSSEGSSERGQYSCEKTPYLIEPMNAFTDPRTETIVMMAAARIGKTEALILNPLAYLITFDPGPAAIYLKGDKLIESFVSQKLNPLLRSEGIRERVHKGGRTKEGGTARLNLRGFDGGSASVLNGDIADNFRSRDLRYIFMDELDALDLDCQGEGSPVNLARKRAGAAHNRKIVLVSSPTFEGGSLIQKEYEASTMEVYQLPCPGCGAYQEIVWERISFEHAKMKCCECDLAFGQFEWLNSGQWRWHARNPVDLKQRGFLLSALVCPWLLWPDLIKEFKRALELSKRGDFSELKTFKNTALAELWSNDEGQRPDSDVLYDRREFYPVEVPDGGLILTCGVDTQDTYLAYSVFAWGLDHECWAIESGFVQGSPADPATLPELDRRVLQREYRQNGRPIKIACAVIDYGGHHAPDIYRFTAKRGEKVIAGRGRGDSAGSITLTKWFPRTSEREQRIEIFVNDAKTRLFLMLSRQEAGPTFVHFPQGPHGEEVRGFDSQYFQQLCSERQARRSVNGLWKTSWVKDAYVRNEMLDCATYALGAYEFYLSRHTYALENAQEAASEWARRQADPNAPPEPERKSPYGAHPLVSSSFGSGGQSSSRFGCG